MDFVWFVMICIEDCIGLLGISLSLYCYARAQWRPDYTKRITYSALNLSSAALLGVSLFHDWNLASFTCNTIWGLISLYGLVRALRPSGRRHKHYAADVRIYLNDSSRARRVTPE